MEREDSDGLNGIPAVRKNSLPDDDFFDNLMRCQGSRIEEQRSELPTRPLAPTVPDEDFFALLHKFQSNRIETQRSKMPDIPVTNDSTSPIQKTSSLKKKFGRKT